MPTMQEVAELAGVSAATVSRVLNNSPLVNDKTRNRVLKVMESVNYHPNSAGQNLRLNRTNQILVTIPDLTNVFFSKIVRSIEKTANKFGYDVLLFETFGNESSELKLAEFISRRKIDGLIHLSAPTHLQHLLTAQKELTTVFACEYFENIDIPSVSIDNVAAAMDATSYLTSLGHRQIVYINGPSSVILCRDRLKGYGIALERAEAPFHGDYVCEGDFTMAGGYAKVKSLLRKKVPFTAVFCANDAMAMGAMKALREVGLRVPDDVSVVGFDNIDIASFSEPGLTTVSQPFDDIGTKAMEMWLTINAGDETKYPVKIPHKLIIRGSCAVPKTHG